MNHNKHIKYQYGGDVPEAREIDPNLKPPIYVPARLKPHGTQYTLTRPNEIIPLNMVGGISGRKSI